MAPFDCPYNPGIFYIEMAPCDCSNNPVCYCCDYRAIVVILGPFLWWQILIGKGHYMDIFLSKTAWEEKLLPNNLSASVSFSGKFFFFFFGFTWLGLPCILDDRYIGYTTIGWHIYIGYTKIGFPVLWCRTLGHGMQFLFGQSVICCYLGVP